MKSKINKLLEIKCEEQVEKLVDNVTKSGKARFRVVGDNECNCGIININTNPMSGTNERIINMQDTYLERLALENEESLSEADLSSPRSLVKKLFNIEGGRIENLNDTKKKADIAKNLIVSFQDSGDEQRPTVDFRDKGMGQLPEDMPTTIMGLNNSSKIKKHYTIGVFGQGGSTSYPSSKYTFIITKKLILGCKNRRTCFTIVRYNERKGNSYKMGVYEYLVDSTTNLPFEIQTTEAEFEAGTLIRHISMDVGKYTQMITQPKGYSLWFFTNLNLFDNMLPIRIEDRRAKMLKKNSVKDSQKNVQVISRTISGNYSRLNNKEDIEDVSNDKKQMPYIVHSIKETFKFYDDEVDISIWVANFNRDKKIMDQFVQKGHPIIITINGQKHGELPNTLIKDKAKLPYLSEDIVIHVNCDKLCYDIRRQMFASTRENIKENNFYDDLSELIVGMLKNDDNIFKLNSEKRALISVGSDKKSLEDIANRVSGKLKNSLGDVFTEMDSEDGNEEATKVREKGHRPTTNGGGGKVYPPIEVKENPEVLNISSCKNRKIEIGKSIWIKVSTDASCDYFKKECNRFKVSITNEQKFQVISKNIEIKGGRGSFAIKALEKCNVDDECIVEVSLKLDDKVLKDSCNLVVIDKKQEEKKLNKKAKIPSCVNINIIEKGTDYYTEHEWDDKSVGNIVFNSACIDFNVHVDNKFLLDTLKKYNSLGEEVKGRIRNSYIEQLAYSLIEYEVLTRDITYIDEEKVKIFREATYEISCKTICSFIADNKNVFGIE